MYKYLVVLLLLASTGIAQEKPQQPHNIDSQVLIHEDIILDVYNSSCIETANYLYLFINNTEIDANNIDWFDRIIIVMNIKQLNPKSVLANIEFL